MFISHTHLQSRVQLLFTYNIAGITIFTLQCSSAASIFRVYSTTAIFQLYSADAFNPLIYALFELVSEHRLQQFGFTCSMLVTADVVRFYGFNNPLLCNEPSVVLPFGEILSLLRAFPGNGPLLFCFSMGVTLLDSKHVTLLTLGT
jgi:hypothetical protein